MVHDLELKLRSETGYVLVVVFYKVVIVMILDNSLACGSEQR